MKDYDTNYNKTAGFDAEKPCTVELNGRTIEATHHFTNADDSLLFLYTGDRADGIDIVVPLRSDKPAFARSTRGEYHLGIETDATRCANPCCDDLTRDGGDWCSGHCQWLLFQAEERAAGATDRDMCHVNERVLREIDEIAEAIRDDTKYESPFPKSSLMPGSVVEEIMAVLEPRKKYVTSAIADRAWCDEERAESILRDLNANGEIEHHKTEDGFDAWTMSDDPGDTNNDENPNAGKEIVTDGGRDVEDGDGSDDEWEMSDEDKAALRDVSIAGADTDTDTGSDDDGACEGFTDEEIEMMRAEEERNGDYYKGYGGYDAEDNDGDALVNGFVENGDGVRVASPRGLAGFIKPGKHGKYECTLCGAVTDSKHGAKSHFGRVHPDADDDDVETALEDEDDDEGEDAGRGFVIGEEFVSDDADGNDDGEGEGEGEGEVPEAWRKAANAYVDARTASIPVTLADARDAVVTALTSECDWMSIVERCEPGTHYDLHRWDDDEGWTDDAGRYISERTAKYLESTASDTEIKHYRSQLARRNYVSQDTINGQTSDDLLIPVGNGTINIDDIEYHEQRTTTEWEYDTEIEYDADTDTVDVTVNVNVTNETTEEMVIDTDTVTVGEMRKENRFIYRIETDWDPENADVEGLDEWLEEVIHAEDERRVLYELAGHALHPRYPSDGFGVLAGRGGSGKSQVLEAIKAMLGSDNVGVRTLKQIEMSNFASGKPIPNCRANINTELEGEQLPKLGTLKTYSAGEELEIEPKGEPAYKGKNDATMLFASDDPPRFPQDNRALGRRLYVIEFPCVYEENPDPNDPLQLQSMGKTEVQEILQSDERLAAMLFRAVEGLVRLLEEGDFTSSKSWQERVAQYEAYSDPVQDFARHALEPDANGPGISSNDLKMTFDRFAEVHEHSGKTIGQIVDVLEEMPGFPVAKTRTRTFSDRQDRENVYEGVAFTEGAIDAWVPDPARHLYCDDEADDIEDGYATETIADIKNDNRLGERDAVMVTVHTSSSRTSYGRAEEGVLTGENDSIQYYVPAMGGISLAEGEDYVIDGALAVEENDDTKLQLLPGMTDVTPIVRGNEDGQDDLDDDGGEVVNDTDADGDVDAKVRQTIDYKASMSDTGNSVTVAKIAGELAGRMDPETVEDAVERLVGAGEITRDDHGRVAIARGDDVDVNEIDMDEMMVQGEREDTVHELVNELEDEHERGAVVSDVIDAASEAMGLTSDDVEVALDRLKRKGEVYEAAEGHLRAAGGD